MTDKILSPPDLSLSPSENYSQKHILMVWKPGERDYSEKNVMVMKEFPDMASARKYILESGYRNYFLFTEDEFKRRHQPRMEVSERRVVEETPKKEKEEATPPDEFAGAFLGTLIGS